MNYVMAVGERVGFNHDLFTHDSLDGITSAVNLRLYTLDNDSSATFVVGHDLILYCLS
jgi:hypothetical protein